MPRTSNRVAAIRKLPPEMRAHYSGRIARSNRAPWMRQRVLDRVGAQDRRDQDREDAGKAGRRLQYAQATRMSLARDVTTVGGNVGVVASLELLGVARATSSQLSTGLSRACARAAGHAI